MLLTAAAGAVALERVAAPWTSPLLARLDAQERVDLYAQITGLTGVLLGFVVTAIAILASLDIRRRIVEDLQRGESFSLLIVNLLAAVALLLATTTLGIVGTIHDDGNVPSRLFESVYQFLVLASLLELVIGLCFFGLVTYKVAAHE